MTKLQRVPFEIRELDPSGFWPEFEPGSRGTPIFQSPITPRENLEMFLKGQKPLWLPCFMEQKMFMPSIVPDYVARGPINEYRPYPMDRLGGADMFGVEWIFDPKAFGAMVRPGNPKVPDINRWEKYICFPDLDAYDWIGSAQANQEFLNDRRAIKMVVYTGLFERLISFVDMGNALMALVDEDEKIAVHRLFDRLCEFYDDLFAHFAKWYHPTLLWFHDDWGSQRAPLISPDVCREMLLPYLKRVVDSAHKYGMGFEFYSCGKNELLVPIMIEAGVDMWAGQSINDKAMLYREYGKDIKLGVDIEPLPRDATPQQLKEAVCRFLDAYPENVYWGMEFTAPRQCYQYVYEESRRRYNP